MQEDNLNEEQNETMTSLLFEHIESQQGTRRWGHVLDAGTGQHSLKWLRTLSTESWTAVTADPIRIVDMQPTLLPHMRPQDRFILGNWDDPTLLENESFDVVLFDYLIGAMDVFSPYSQDLILPRIRPLVTQRLYLIGLEPTLTNAYHPTDSTGATLLDQLDKLKAACRILAGKRPYREYPASWIARQAKQAGFSILEIKHFPRTLRQGYVQSRLRACRQLLPDITHPELQRGLAKQIDTIETQLLPIAKQHGIPFGANYVITARPD